MLSKKFKPQNNETIFLLQHCKLAREEKESAEEWMSHLRIKGNESEYKGRDRRLMKSMTIK